MKPKTRIQKEVAKLFPMLPKLTERQTAYAYEHCFKHYAHRTKAASSPAPSADTVGKADIRLRRAFAVAPAPLRKGT